MTTKPNNNPQAENAAEIAEAAEVAVSEAEEAAARGDHEEAGRIAERFSQWLEQQNSHFQTTLETALKPIQEALERLSNPKPEPQNPQPNPPQEAPPIPEKPSGSEPEAPAPNPQNAPGDAPREAETPAPETPAKPIRKKRLL